METIFSMRLAGRLMAEGFVLVGMEESRRHKGKNVFFFNDSEELQSYIKKYKKDNLIRC